MPLKALFLVSSKTVNREQCTCNDVASAVQAQFAIFSLSWCENVAMSTFFAVAVCKIHQNKDLDTSF